MTARDLNTGRIYEGTKTFIAAIIGKHRHTVSRWEADITKEYVICNGFEVRFINIKREKNNRGRKYLK